MPNQDTVHIDLADIVLPDGELDIDFLDRIADLGIRILLSDSRS